MEREKERERANFLVEYDTDTILIIDLKGVTKRLLQMLHPVAKVGRQIDRPDMKHGPFNSSSLPLGITAPHLWTRSHVRKELRPLISSLSSASPPHPTPTPPPTF